MRTPAEIKKQILVLRATKPDTTRYPAGHNRCVGQIMSLRRAREGNATSQRELLLEVVSDALIEFGDEAMERRVGPGDIEAWVDKRLKRESLVGEAKKGYHEANHPVSSQYAEVGKLE